jgi:hypothetical protein
MAPPDLGKTALTQQLRFWLKKRHNEPAAKQGKALVAS